MRPRGRKDQLRLASTRRRRGGAVMPTKEDLRTERRGSLTPARSSHYPAQWLEIIPVPAGAARCREGAAPEVTGRGTDAMAALEPHSHTWTCGACRIGAPFAIVSAPGERRPRWERHRSDPVERCHWVRRNWIRRRSKRRAQAQTRPRMARTSGPPAQPGTALVCPRPSRPAPQGQGSDFACSARQKLRATTATSPRRIQFHHKTRPHNATPART